MDTDEWEDHRVLAFYLLQPSFLPSQQVSTKWRLSFALRNGIIFFKDFIYLFMRDTEREAETQAEGEAGSMRESLMRDLIPGLQDHTLGCRRR